MLYSLYGPPVMANEVVEMLSRLVYMAEGWGSTPEGGNPCKFMHKYNMHSRERFRSGEEFRRLGRVLGEVEACASAAAALRLLMLTGRQRNEILTLRWVDVDLGAGAIQLRDAKTSARSVAPPTAARHMLAVIPRLPDNPWVIAGARPCTDLSNLDSAWLVVRDALARPGFRKSVPQSLQDSNHASVAAHDRRFALLSAIFFMDTR